MSSFYENDFCGIFAASWCRYLVIEKHMEKPACAENAGTLSISANFLNYIGEHLPSGWSNIESLGHFHSLFSYALHLRMLCLPPLWNIFYYGVQLITAPNQSYQYGINEFLSSQQLETVMEADWAACNHMHFGHPLTDFIMQIWKKYTRNWEDHCYLSEVWCVRICVAAFGKGWVFHSKFIQEKEYFHIPILCKFNCW